MHQRACCQTLIGCTSSRNTGVLAANDVELVERVHKRFQEARSGPAVQDNGEAGRNALLSCRCDSKQSRSRGEPWTGFSFTRGFSGFPGNYRELQREVAARVDENVGRLRQELIRLQLAERTAVVFVSDHSCHFRTRNPEYKRSAHESSVHLPLVICGPGFGRSRTIKELVSQIDLGPTLLEFEGISVPDSMQGRSFLRLAVGDAASWRNEAFMQMSESMMGRALRTPQWTYVVAEPDGKSHAMASTYVEYQLYDLFSDPHQLVNLAGRRETREIATHLRERLLARRKEAGDETGGNRTGASLSVNAVQLKPRYSLKFRSLCNAKTPLLIPNGFQERDDRHR